MGVKRPHNIRESRKLRVRRRRILFIRSCEVREHTFQSQVWV
jgi:hypothetical protein